MRDRSHGNNLLKILRVYFFFRLQDSHAHAYPTFFSAKSFMVIAGPHFIQDFEGEGLLQRSRPGFSRSGCGRHPIFTKEGHALTTPPSPHRNNMEFLLPNISRPRVFDAVTIS